VLSVVGGLAGGAVDDEPVAAAVDEVGRQPLGSVDVQGASARNGGDHGHEDAAEGRAGAVDGAWAQVTGNERGGAGPLSCEEPAAVWSGS